MARTEAVEAERGGPAGPWQRLLGLRHHSIVRYAIAYCVAAWLIVQVAATIGPAFELPNWFLRAVIVAAVLGFLLTVGGAAILTRPWQSGAARSRQRGWLLGGALVLLVVSVVALALLARETVLGNQKITVAVLPFTDLSPKRDQAYLAEGMGEEILTALATNPEIQVIGRTTAAQIARDPDPERLRGQLGITHVLEGSARTAGDQLRITVRLLETSTGKQIWAEEYDRLLSNVFAVQDEISAAVAKRLIGTLSGTPQRVRESTGVDTYALYLAARSKMRDRNEQSLQEALRLVRQVLAQDAGYAPAHALHAELLSLLSYANYGRIPVDQAVQSAIPHARRAIALAPDKPEGYAALGLVLLGTEPDRAIAPLLRAIRLDPARGELRHWLAVSYNYVGRNTESLQQRAALLEMEPLWPQAIYLYVLALAGSGRSDEAFKVVDAFERRGGSPAEAAVARASIAALLGDLSRAASLARNALRLESKRVFARAILAWTYYRLGSTPLAEKASAGEPIYSRLLYSGRYDQFVRQVRSDGAGAWAKPDAAVAVAGLARARDWAQLELLYDTAPGSFQDLCVETRGIPDLRLEDPLPTLSFALALRNRNRSAEAAKLLECTRARLAKEERGNVRSPHFSEAELAFHKAQVLAVDGNRTASLQWLGRAASLGWLGTWQRLHDYPALEPLRPLPEFASIQRRIDQRVTEERAQVLRDIGRR